MSLKKAFSALHCSSALNARGTGGETCLTRSVKMGLAEVAKDFLELGANPDRENAAGEKPLTIALGMKDLAMIKTLLDGGADTSLKKDGLDFRQQAQKAGLRDVVRLIQAVEEERYARAVAMSMCRGF